MKKINKLYAVCGAALLCGAVSASAAVTVIGQDAANDAVYADGWTDGDNGGTGFTAWAFAEGDSLFDITSSAGLGTGAPDIDTDGVSFKMLNNGASGYVHGTRHFAAPLSPGDQIELDMTAFGQCKKNQGFNFTSSNPDKPIGSVGFPYNRDPNVLGIYPGGEGMEFSGLTEPASFVVTALQTSDSGGMVTVISDFGETISAEYVGVITGIELFAKPLETATETDAMYFNSFVLTTGHDIPPPPPPEPTEDFANDEDYDDAWTNGDNGGYGFAAWSSSGDAYQMTIGDATGLHADIPLNTDGKAFRIISTNGYAQILRNFSEALPVGTAFSIDVAAGLSQNNQGFQLRTYGATVNTPGILTLANRTSTGGWTVTTADGSADFIDSAKKEAKENTWFNVTMKQTTLEGGIYTIKRFGEITGTMTGTYTGAVGAFKFYASVQEDVDAQAMFCNNLIIAIPAEFEILDFGLAAGNATLTFPSEEGKIYKIQGCEDLMADSWTNVSDIIEATAPENTNTISAAGASFFRITEADRFFEDFENGLNGWIMDNQTPGSGRTEWEIGVPMTTNENMVVTNAYSPTSCAATVLDDIYGKDNTMAANTLRSPVISLGTAEAAELSYFECASIEDYDEIALNILDSSGTLVTNIYSFGGDVELDHLLISNWTERVISLPVSDLPADIILEFSFNPDNFNEGDFSGWYIDDVKIK